MQLDENAINVFVDGSAMPTPRRGGIGIRLIWVGDDGQEVIRDEPSVEAVMGATNNQMELRAVIDALKLLAGRHSPVPMERFTKVVIHTDSRYVADNYGNAKFSWPRNRWRNRENRPVKNPSEWKELVKASERLYREHHMRVDIVWVPGKSDEHTKRVDKIAKQSAKTGLRRPGRPKRVRRKWSERELDPGCVKLTGQWELVRIVTDEWLRPQRVYLYTYEVVDVDSRHYKFVDEVFSDELLKAGHVYRVRFNDDSAHPQIVELEGEVTLTRPVSGGSVPPGGVEPPRRV